MARDKKKHLESVYRNTARYIERNQKLIFDFLLKNPCVTCGENDPVVLEFDHNDDVEKISTISKLVRTGSSIEKILKEIDKCTVMCANCHRRKTAKQLGWFRDWYMN